MIITKILKTLTLFLAEIIGLVVVPVALMFCSRDCEHLPRPFDWAWGNAWDTINGRSNRNHWEDRWGVDGVRKFWPRFLWLAIRNRAPNMSQLLGKANPSPDETWKAEINIPFTNRMFRCRWGYTSYYPGTGLGHIIRAVKVMPKRNFTTTISLRRRNNA